MPFLEKMVLVGNVGSTESWEHASQSGYIGWAYHLKRVYTVVIVNAWRVFGRCSDWL